MMSVENRITLMIYLICLIVICWMLSIIIILGSFFVVCIKVLPIALTIAFLFAMILSMTLLLNYLVKK